MDSSETYRQLATRERSAAGCTGLANRKAVHERAALTWERLAEQAEVREKKQAERGQRPLRMEPKE